MNSTDQQGGPADFKPSMERLEILEERGNRDAFQICVLLLAVIALALVVLGIAAFNTRFVVMANGSTLGAITPEREFPVSRNGAGFGVSKLDYIAAPLGVAAPRNLFVLAAHVAHPLRPVPHQGGRVLFVGAKSDAGAVVTQSCRPEFTSSNA